MKNGTLPKWAPDAIQYLINKSAAGQSTDHAELRGTLEDSTGVAKGTLERIILEVEALLAVVKEKRDITATEAEVAMSSKVKGALQFVGGENFEANVAACKKALTEAEAKAAEAKAAADAADAEAARAAEAEAAAAKAAADARAAADAEAARAAEAEAAAAKAKAEADAKTALAAVAAAAKGVNFVSPAAEVAIYEFVTESQWLVGQFAKDRLSVAKKILEWLLNIKKFGGVDLPSVETILAWLEADALPVTVSIETYGRVAMVLGLWKGPTKPTAFEIWKQLDEPRPRLKIVAVALKKLTETDPVCSANQQSGNVRTGFSRLVAWCRPKPQSVVVSPPPPPASKPPATKTKWSKKRWFLLLLVIALAVIGAWAAGSEFLHWVRTTSDGF